MKTFTCPSRLVAVLAICLINVIPCHSAPFIIHSRLASRVDPDGKAIAASDGKAIADPGSAVMIAHAEISHAMATKTAARKAVLRALSMEAANLFNEMQLEDSGLNRKALEYALVGYHRLLKRRVLRKTDLLTVCDFSQSSGSKRMYVIDIRNRKLLYRTYVAHGVHSGREYANSFSNKPESYKSSLGFYVTRNTYCGRNGLSLRIDGVEKGINNMARKRNIVVHGASYVSERILHKYGVMGTTFGCPAIPEEMSKQIIPVLKNGSCFFIYYPSRKYLSRSAVLNG